MTDLEILRAARAKIEQGWCQRVYAMDAQGRAVMSTEVQARSWCCKGAINAVAHQGGRFPGNYEALLGIPNVAEFNDAPYRSQSDVLDLFSRAIAKLETSP